ncbi:LamG domain-containing protein [Bremerella sp. JC817]|uniref:LamG domain-containing protein n=1 Tax=Bremerella sp. JC817 TaxID=3231756 RepID=UPI003458ACA3
MSFLNRFRLLLLMLLLAVGSLAAPIVQADTILLVTANNGSLTGEESARRSSFQSWGYAVSTIWAGSSQAAIDSATLGAQVVYISEEVNSADLGTKLRTTSVGVINEENFLDDDFGFSDAVGSERSGSSIWVLGANQNISITGAAQQLTQMEGNLAPGAQIVARTTSNTGKVTIVSLEKGAQLANNISGNSTAAGRRVRMPFGGEPFQWSSLNSNGLYIVQEALNFARATADQTLLHWRLDEGTGGTIYDASGANRHGSFQTGTPTWITGPRNGALDFSGGNDVRSSAAFDPPAQGSVAFWMKRDDAVTSTERILGTGDDWEIRIEPSGIVAFDLGANNTSGSFETTTALNAINQWYHIVAIYDSIGDTFTIYVNGKLHRSGSVGLNDPSGNYLSLGTRTGTADRFDGTIDDLRIYNYQLSETQVAELYGLIGHWKFNEGSGSVANDSSAFKNHANISGATWTTDCAGNVALAFNGSGAVATTTSSVTPPEQGSIAFWFISEAPYASNQRLWGIGDNYEIRQAADGVVYCDVSGNGIDGGFFTTEPLDETMKAYHFVASYDNADDTYAIYIDGELHKSGVSSVDLSTQAGGILSFGTRTGSTEYWQGTMRDFRLYNRKILESEVLQLAGVAAHYELDETSGSIAYDSTAANNDATYYGAPTLGTPGPDSSTLGTAVELDGSTQYITSNKSLLNSLPQFTIAGWIYLDTLNANQSFFGQNDVIEFGIRGRTGQVHLWTANGGFFYVGGTLKAGQWIHVAAVGNGTEIVAYVNGLPVASSSRSTTSYGTSSYSFKIGEGVYAPTGDYLDGRVDDVRVFTRALCPAEILALASGHEEKGIRIIKWVEVQ